LADLEDMAVTYSRVCAMGNAKILDKLEKIKSKNHDKQLLSN
jgi:hypothetical protein